MELCRTLMCRDRELLDFEVDSVTGDVTSVHVLDESCFEHGAQAPSFVGGGEVSGSLASDVKRMLRRRSLSPKRADLSNILEATGAESSIELSLLSRGCSLSDQYWYRPKGSSLRWSDVNFFDNDWDLAFGEAVLLQDWTALGRASIETPDVTCSGWTRKAWVLEEGAPRLLKAAAVNGIAYIESEIIATRMLSRLLKPSEYVPYEKVHRFGQDLTACNHMLGSAEEHVPADALLGAMARPVGNVTSTQNAGVISTFAQILSELGIEEALQVAAQASVVATLTLSKDMHFFNYGAIRNVETGVYRASPLYDYGGAFGLSTPMQTLEELCESPAFILLALIRVFSELDRTWDYAWYDPQALQGFDEELEDAIAAIDGVPAAYPRFIRRAFSTQLAYVNEITQASMAHHA